MTAFFASRQCPGIAIRAAMDWALHQARVKNVVISGFYSPLEQSVLKVLTQARSPVVVVLARPVNGAKLPPDWAEPLALGHLTVVTAATKAARLTGETATARNNPCCATSHPHRGRPRQPGRGARQLGGAVAVGRATEPESLGMTVRSVKALDEFIIFRSR